MAKAVKPEIIDAKSFKVVLGMECKDDKVYQQIDDDPLLLAQLTSIASEVYKDIVDGMIDSLEDAERKCVFGPRADWAKNTKQLDNDFDKLIEASQKIVEVKAIACIEKLNKLKKDVNIDTAKLVFKVTTALSGLAFATASLITTPFTFGVGGVMGLIGMARTIASLAALIADRAKEIEKMVGDVRKDATELAKEFKDNEKKARALDLAKEAFNAVVFPADVLKSSKQLKGKLDTIEVRLRKIDVETHKLAKDIKSMMNALDKGDGEIKKMRSEAGANQSLVKQLDKAEKKIDEIEKKLNLTIEKVIDGQGKVKTFGDEVDELSKLLEEISAMKSKVEKVAEILLRASADLVASGLSADFTAAADTVSFTIDLATGLKDTVEDLKDL
ncbi:MAG TPA: hypothetical protein VL574_16445 [Stellaceae bacterium]|nr:hypothetical protein [Stellaceae bacterium]